MDTYVIYKHTSPSGKSYIGQTKNYNKRCKQHQSSGSECRHISRAIEKHGWDNFQHEILMEGLSLEEANIWEPTLILEYNTLAPNGYNLRTGGLNSSCSDETKSKIGGARLGKKRPSMSDEQKAKISVANKGKPRVPHSDEAKHKMSTSKLGKPQGPHSEETKAKMSAAKLGKKRGPYKKKLKVEPNIGST